MQCKIPMHMHIFSYTIIFLLRFIFACFLFHVKLTCTTRLSSCFSMQLYRTIQIQHDVSGGGGGDEREHFCRCIHRMIVGRKRKTRIS